MPQFLPDDVTNDLDPDTIRNVAFLWVTAAPHDHPIALFRLSPQLFGQACLANSGISEHEHGRGTRWRRKRYILRQWNIRECPLPLGFAEKVTQACLFLSTPYKCAVLKALEVSGRKRRRLQRSRLSGIRDL